MEADRPGFSYFSDLSANLFAAILFVLIAATALARRDAQSMTRVDQRLAQAVARQPLDSAAMIRLLYDRRAAAPGLSLDLHTRDMAATGALSSLRLDPETSGFPARLAEASRANPGPIRLYVFANDLYPAVRRALPSGAIPELSVPIALRDPTGEAWSAAFLDLTEGSIGLADFRLRLAALLDSRGPTSAGLRGAPAGSAEALDPVAVARRALRAVATTLAYAALFGSILFIERRSRRRRPS